MKITWDNVAQAGVLLSFVSMVMMARKNKWGWIVGFLSQPFWFITALSNHQTGVLLNTVCFTGVYIYGAWKWFWEKTSEQEEETAEEVT